ncbi:hypothetical protein L1987_18005 [Smallanthus sonchifolius]|uniref:Uncharacterized protein n=1 Tax=Smallanthus sonchifolius TaxID=185202 RepID=A0ACB9IZ46_9ASTR|nr:hypothetical protein L1987_18005 [Smallanthus sonchifolius]
MLIERSGNKLKSLIIFFARFEGKLGLSKLRVAIDAIGARRRRRGRMDLASCFGLRRNREPLPPPGTSGTLAAVAGFLLPPSASLLDLEPPLLLPVVAGYDLYYPVVCLAPS